ncbi:MAG TPA: hypothetical protein VNX68_03120 [Nitrosopumilaceae archaeon]|nr:hypothetical protein [Nitrosopumilaceae archaeon]
MNSLQIEHALLSDPSVRDQFVGVFPADAIPEKQYPGAYIVNTDSSNEPGQHWVAFYCTEKNQLEAFDSFGQDPGVYSEHIKEWMGNDYLILSKNILQSEDSTLCGNYCMYFILLRCHGFSYEDVISIFCSDRNLSDKYVCKFINKYFKLRTKIQDNTFILKKLLQK